MRSTSLDIDMSRFYHDAVLPLDYVPGYLNPPKSKAFVFKPIDWDEIRREVIAREIEAKRRYKSIFHPPYEKKHKLKRHRPVPLTCSCREFSDNNDSNNDTSYDDDTLLASSFDEMESEQLTINPATGLPCTRGGIDAGGNPYGFDLSHDHFQDNSGTSCFDDSCVSIDDSSTWEDTATIDEPIAVSDDWL